LARASRVPFSGNHEAATHHCRSPGTSLDVRVAAGQSNGTTRPFCDAVVLGDATAFFDLTKRQAHHLLCDCHYNGTMTAAGVAARVRSIANQVTLREFWDRIRFTVMAGR
jgi:hypothetical protein